MVPRGKTKQCCGWDEEGKVPRILYPNECNSCGACEYDCMQFAIKVVLPPWLQLTYAERIAE